MTAPAAAQLFAPRLGANQRSPRFLLGFGQGGKGVRSVRWRVVRGGRGGRRVWWLELQVNSYICICTCMCYPMCLRCWRWYIALVNRENISLLYTGWMNQGGRWTCCWWWHWWWHGVWRLFHTKIWSVTMWVNIVSRVHCILCIIGWYIYDSIYLVWHCKELWYRFN